MGQSGLGCGSWLRASRTSSVRYIAKQRGIIDQLEADGRDAGDAREILAYLEELHAMNLAEHKRITEEN